MLQLRPAMTALAALALLCAATARAADRPSGTVTRVIIRDDRGLPYAASDDLRSLMLVAPGQPYSADAVSAGVRYLYLKKRFRDIEVEAVPEEGGVRLEYTLYPLTLVEKVVLRGNHSLSERAVLDVIGQVAGRELRDEQLIDVRAGIQAAYQAEGFYNVRVNFLRQPADEPYREHLYVYIQEPRRTLIEAVRFTGNRVLSSDELLSVMRNRPGRPLLTNVLMEEDLNAIRAKYADAGYPAAAPGPVNMSFQDERAVLELGGSEGPRTTVVFEGNRAFSDRKLRGEMLLWSEHDVSDTAIESSLDKIRNLYRDEGYADVRAEVRKREGPSSLDLTIVIQEGPRVAVRDMRIEGAAAFTPRQVMKMMTTQPSSWYRSRPFRADLLDKDLDVIAEQYATAGYLAATARASVSRTADGSGALVTVTVIEGPRTLTGVVTFEGNRLVPPQDLAAAVRLRTGEPFSERLVEEDRYRILSLYASRGHLYARVEAEKVPAAGKAAGAGASVDVRFRIEEDRPVTIGTVILRGNVATRDHVILRELEPRTGEPYDYEKSLKSQQRVYRYGYFGTARFEPVHPEAKEYRKDMLFTVEERPAGAVEFGVGYGDLDHLRGFVEVSHRNLWGVANFASLRLEGSDILKRASFTYQYPWLLDVRNLDGKIVVARSDSKRINQDTREVYYETRKTTASYGAEYTKERLKTSLTYQFENVENFNVQPAAQLSPEDRGHVLISSLIPAVIWDLRDDPFNPHHGSVHGANLKEAMAALGSEAVFSKLTVQSSWFLPLSDAAVIALSGRGGRAWPHGATLEVPIHERFYLGGGTTVRGYTQDSIGPGGVDASGKRVPTGGLDMVQLNAELRLMAPAGSGIVLFADAGNVWIDRRIDINDLRASYGAGFRYLTPVGPLRIDYGQKIHRRSGESPGELHFNIGHAF